VLISNSINILTLTRIITFHLLFEIISVKSPLSVNSPAFELTAKVKARAKVKIRVNNNNSGAGELTDKRTEFAHTYWWFYINTGFWMQTGEIHVLLSKLVVVVVLSEAISPYMLGLECRPRSSLVLSCVIDTVCISQPYLIWLAGVMATYTYRKAGASVWSFMVKGLGRLIYNLHMLQWWYWCGL